MAVDMTTPRGKNILVYDLEIVNEVDGKEVTWNDHHKMGIAVGVVYSFLTGDFRVFLPDMRREGNDWEAMVEALAEGQMVSGFNVHNFDHPLLSSGLPLGESDPRIASIRSRTYDLLYESRLSMGWRPGEKWPKGLNLDSHLEACFGFSLKKTENAAEAPKIYKSGDCGRVISYCIADVRREALLFDRVWKLGKIASTSHGEHAICRKPQDWGTLEWKTDLDWKPGF
jgi:hypothetical protein